jgi:hypothetical protein
MLDALSSTTAAGTTRRRRPWRRALCEGIRALGLEALGWSRTARLLRARIRYSGCRGHVRRGAPRRLENWALPVSHRHPRRRRPARFDPSEALRSLVGWQGMAEVDRLAPQHWTSPLGRNLAIDYGGERPRSAVRLQEVLGTTAPPDRRPGRLPIRMVLLSPANRPIQVTTDLPGFWAGSYADVRKDMRAQYPRHPWPEDPPPQIRRCAPSRAGPDRRPLLPRFQIPRGAPNGAGAEPPPPRKGTTRSVSAGSRGCPRRKRQAAFRRRPRAGMDALGGVEADLAAWRARNHLPALGVVPVAGAEASVM